MLATREPPQPAPQCTQSHRSAHRSTKADEGAAVGLHVSKQLRRQPRSKGLWKSPSGPCMYLYLQQDAVMCWTAWKGVGTEVVLDSWPGRANLCTYAWGGAACTAPRPTNERCCCAPAGDHISCSAVQLRQQCATHLCQLASSLVVTLRATWLACGAEEGSRLELLEGVKDTNSRRRCHVPALQ